MEAERHVDSLQQKVAELERNLEHVLWYDPELPVLSLSLSRNKSKKKTRNKLRWIYGGSGQISDIDFVGMNRWKNSTHTLSFSLSLFLSFSLSVGQLRSLPLHMHTHSHTG